MSCSGYGLDTFTCFWCLGMMLTGQKGTNTPSLLKWKQRGSALTTRLLNNIPSEVELSDLGRIPSSGSESPSGLLNGEGLNAEPIADLDLFFERIYNYYCEKGLWCIIIKWVVELLGLGFTICFSGFFLLFVDWNGLRNAKCGMDAVESGLKPCDLSKEALHQHPLTPLTLSKSIIVGYLAIFSIYWIFCFLKFFAQLKDTLSIRHFYYNSLYLTDNEIQTMPWASVLEKVVNMQSSQKLCVVKDLDAHDVVMRLMRKENYLIGMLNKGIIAFPISKWFPGAGPTVKHAPNCRQYRLMLTKTLEWTLNWCILQSMFDRNFCVQKDFIYNPKTLKKRLVLVGLVMLLLSPFLVIFMLVYLFLRHAEQFYNHPGTASSRRWSNLSRWVFREFNEVDHLFKHRINSSFVHASEYLRQFPSPIISIIAKFISFISGGFAAILIIIAFLEESLLEGHIFGRNLFWYAAVFGTITAISRAAVTEELLVLDPEGAMSQLVQHSHYMPKRWRGKENTEIVRMEIETLYQYTGMMLLEEMASIFLTPYLLMFIVPKRVDDILQFIADFTVDIEGVGHVCSFSVFDFQNHGNNNYGSPYSSSRAQRSSQGKMEKSFLSFQSSYPSWEPNAQGKQFLSMLRHFKEQNSNSPTRTWRGNPNLRVHNSSRPDNHFDSLRLIDPHEKTHPYLLDLYYTSRSRRSSCIIPPSECVNDFWAPPDLTQNELKCEHYSVDPFEDQLQSHLEASASTSLFPESEFRERNLGSAFPRRGSNSSVKDTGSHWWARGASRGENPHASFLEPPGFHHYIARSGRGDDGLSEKSVEEEEGRWGRSSRNLSTTAEFEVEGDVRLHFDDIYSGPLDATYSSSFG